jgi:acetyl esterase/lipase
MSLLQLTVLNRLVPYNWPPTARAIGANVLKNLLRSVLKPARYAALVLAVVSVSAYGQTVDEIHAQLRVLAAQGGNLRVTSQNLYLGLHEQMDRSDVEVTRDVRYGPHPDHVLDVYAPVERGDELLPIVVFVHGGLLGNGDKRSGGAEAYVSGNIPTFFARHGFIGITANYRLVPDVVWPQGAEDMREILGWLRTENGAEFGGDRDAMFMIGQSGGARHLASYLFHRTSQMVRSTELRGAVLFSPRLGLSDSDTFKHYYGDDLEVQAQNSPIGLVESFDINRPTVPTLLVTTEFDGSNIQVPTSAFFAAICEKYQKCPRLAQLKDHNRFSTVLSFDTGDETVSGVVLDFFRGIYDSLER